MIINFVGNFARGYVGEVADETHLADEIENLGHTVRRIPRDEWKAHIETGNKYVNVPEDLRADANIICKWHHFNNRVFAEKLREKSQAPVFLWVWDYMVGDDGKLPDWHYEMIQGADVYLGNDVRSWSYLGNLLLNKKAYYFPFDVADKNFDKVEADSSTSLRINKKYDVVFFGSHFPKGDRVEWLKQLNQIFPVKIFSWNWQDWQKDGFADAEQAVWGEDFAQKVAESKIILQFSVNDHCWGYWSNRIGKVLTVGGFLLARYAPGMELFLKDGADYFSTVEEMVAKVRYYLDNPTETTKIAARGYQIGRADFTSEARIRQLLIFIERYLKGAF